MPREPPTVTSEPLLFGRDMALTLEQGAAHFAREYAQAQHRAHPERTIEVVDTLGGVVVFDSANPGWAKGIGIGLTGPAGAPEVDAFETHFRDRGLPGRAYMSPYAHPALFRELGRRGWFVEGWMQMLVREVASGDDDLPWIPDVDVEVVDGDRRAEWALEMAEAFYAPKQPDPGAVAMYEGFAVAPGVVLYRATVDGEPAGAAAMAFRKGWATVIAAATRPRFRRRGVHRALLTRRLADAADRGARFTVYACDPGSDSQRNARRAGYQVAYTRAIMLREW